MAETNSKQAIALAAGNKLNAHENGRVRTIVMTTEDTFSQLAINDTLASGQFIPKGCRITGVRKNHDTGTASSTFDLGIRERDGTVVSAAGLTSVSPLTTATTASLQCGNGALLAAGVDYVTLTDVEIYLTAKGAVLAANQDVRIEVDYIGS